MNVPSDIPAVDNESKECNCTEDGLPYCGDPECDIDFCRECGDEYTDPCPRHRPHCECDSHTGLGEDLWQCDECGEVIRYVDDPTGTVTLTTLMPRSDRRVRIEMVTPGSRPGDRRWWS